MSTHVAEAKLTVEDKSLTLPAVHATDGADALGILALLKDTGTVTYDPGLRQHRVVQDRHHLHRR